MLKVLVAFSWLVIVSVIIAFFSDVTLSELEKSLNAVYLYQGWQWLIALIMLSMALRGLRWILFFNNTFVGRKSALFLYHGWFFILSLMSLFRVGEVIRVEWLKEKGMTPSLSISYIFIEKLSDAFVLSIFLIVGFMLLSNLDLFLSALVGCFFITLYFMMSFYSEQAHRILERIKSRVTNIFLQKTLAFFGKVALYSTVLQNKGFNLALMLFTAFIWFCVAYSFHLFIAGQYPFVPFYASALIVAMVNLTGVLNISPANIGPFELCVAVILLFYGVSEVEASIFAVTLHFLVMGATISYGLICRGLIKTCSMLIK